MAFRHGVYKSEVPTSIIAPSQAQAGLPVIVGTAPIFMGDISCINKPVLCNTYEEAVSIFGYSADWEKYTLCEFIYSQFALYGQSPCILINVFDPSKHIKEVSGGTYTSTTGSVNLGQNIIKADDLPISYDEEGNAIVPLSGTSLTVSKIIQAKPEQVGSSEVIGGVNASTGQYTGLELLNQIYPKFRLIPGLIGCPKWSSLPEVAAVMRAKADNISGLFTASAVIDIPSDSSGALTYSDVAEWKSKHNFTAPRQIACWPKFKLGDKTYHASTQTIGCINQTDNNHEDIPYKSPSNELLQIDSCVNDNGDEILLTLEQANYLNSQGVVTALNWTGGWRLWGNRTAAYPDNTDAKDCFIPVRRMMDYLSNQFITTFWQKTDSPMEPRLIRSIVNTFNLYLNSLVSREMLLGARVEFREDENAMTDLLNGILKFHIFMTPPLPAEVIEGIFEYDPQYLRVLYEAL